MLLRSKMAGPEQFDITKFVRSSIIQTLTGTIGLYPLSLRGRTG
jgi:hypothetical protein